MRASFAEQLSARMGTQEASAPAPAPKPVPKVKTKAKTKVKAMMKPVPKPEPSRVSVTVTRSGMKASPLDSLTIYNERGSVVGRSPVWKAAPGDEPILVVVTPQATAMVVSSEHVGEPYLKLLNGVKGGRVWFYLYGKNQPLHALRGKKVVAQVEEIVLRVYESGFQDVYANLRVVPDGVATHNLVAHSTTDQFNKTEHTLFDLSVPHTEGIVHLRKLAPKPDRK